MKQIHHKKIILQQKFYLLFLTSSSMALGDVIHQKKIVESMIKRSIEQEERGNNNFVDFTEIGNSSLSRFTQQMMIDRSARIQLKKVSSIVRPRGLSVSLKKQSMKQLMLSGKDLMSNPQYDVQKQIRQRRIKMGETLMRTAHTVGQLDKSVNAIVKKVTIDNHGNNALKEANRITTYYNKGHQSQRTFIAKNIQTSTKQLANSNSFQSVYGICISSPKKIQLENHKHIITSPSKNCSNKLKDMRERHFLRSSHENKSHEMENGPQKTTLVNKNNFLSPLTKLNSNNEKNCSRLSTMISKPMISSIIIPQNSIKKSSLSHLTLPKPNQKLNYEQQQPQSPVLRLKKRLQMNSINCIFQRETIMSHYEINSQQMRQSLMQVQESFIVHRSVMEDLLKVKEEEHCFLSSQQQLTCKGFGYKRYLAVEKKANLLVTVKQMRLQKFNSFVHQLRVYEQIEAARLRLTDQTMNSILGLIKHSTQQQIHLILKAPFTQSLQNYLLRQVDNSNIENFIFTISKAFTDLEKIGLTLNRQPKIQDFVIVFDEIKIQNFSIFSMNKNDEFLHQVKSDDLIQRLREEIVEYVKNKNIRY